ncbi:ATP-binding cassette domain-containing protein [Solwaraspora sp. WMMB335]|uniref:ATP-binding cassette domain-containing protein n=1 Tax=Solwaraspora sp. WMMB335 TaxID=3404118 RepID=UPI003B95CCCF
MSHAIWADGLVKRFGPTTALAGVDLAVRTGTVFGLLGPNGAGKTTAVRVLATLLRPDAGQARVHGFDVVRQAHQVRQRIGLTGQYASVDETLTGSENLLMIGRLLGLSRPDARARASQLLREFHLTDAADRAAKTYSGGMRRRLDLAASLVGRPPVLFLDEPTTGLDPRSRNELWELIRGLVAGGVTVLLTTQYLEEADQLADELAVVDHGRVIASGTPEQLKAKTGAQVLAVRPADPADLPTVLATLRELAGHEPVLAQTTVTVSTTDAALLPAVVRRLDDRGVRVGELALRGSSLDEVFLSLTGHPAEPGASGPPTSTGQRPTGRQQPTETMEGTRA